LPPNKPGLLVTFLIAACLLHPAAAPEATRIKFAGSGPGAGFAFFAPPLRGVYRYANVNSKYNQPRSVRGGSNPHQGIDLDTGGKGETVYPPTRGKVVRLYTGTGGNRIMVIQLDWNRDGSPDNLYVTYMHLSRSFVKVGDIVDKNTAVALSGGSGGYDPHLHFEFNTDFDYAGTDEGVHWASLPAYPYYRGIRHWNHGRDLDFITDVSWRENRYLSAVVYANDEYGYHSVREGDVLLYYRRTGTPDWSGPLLLTKKGDIFSFDLASLALPREASIDFLLQARRDDIRPFYNAAFYPPKYYRPPPPSGAPGIEYEYFSIRVR
jgi:murein DD-endopeptidase MepM/ murein hydrolase activator NlpD